MSTIVGGGRSRVAGAANGVGSSATFRNPFSLAFVAGTLFVNENGNGVVRALNVTTAATSVAVGGGAGGATVGCGIGFGTNALFTLGSSGASGGGIDTDASGTTLYISDGPCNRIRIATLTNGAYYSALVAGSGTGLLADGVGTFAAFNAPAGIAAIGATLYVADSSNNVIRSVTAIVGGVATTFAGGGASGGTAIGYVDATGVAAKFNAPSGLVALSSGAALFVAEAGGHTIRKVTVPGAVVTTVAGGAGASTAGYANAVGTSALFNQPWGLALDAANLNLWVADYANNVVRSIVLATSVVSAVGVRFTPPNSPGNNPLYDGAGAAAYFSNPGGVAFDAAGNLYVADSGNNVVRVVTAPATAPVVATFAGGAGISPQIAGYYDSSTGAQALFNGPRAAAMDVFGNVYVTDYSNNRIRVLNATSRAVTSLTGPAGNVDGVGTNARLGNVYGITFDMRDSFYFADLSNARIRRLTASSGLVQTVAGSTAGANDGLGTSARFNGPMGVDYAAGLIFVADYNNNAVRTVQVGWTADDDDFSVPWGSAPPVVTTLCGNSGQAFANGVGTNAKLNRPVAVTADAAGAIAYVADSYNCLIRMVVVSTKTVTTLAGGSGGVTCGFTNAIGTNAAFNLPFGIAIDAFGYL